MYIYITYFLNLSSTLMEKRESKGPINNANGLRFYVIVGFWWLVWAFYKVLSCGLPTIHNPVWIRFPSRFQCLTSPWNPRYLLCRNSIHAMRTPMATRAMSGRGLLRAATYPPISSFISLRFFHPSSRHSPLRVGIPEFGHGCSLNAPGFGLTRQFPLQSLSQRVYTHSLVNYVMEELAVIRTNRRIRATIK